MTSPAVSVVIPTRGAQAAVADVLDSLKPAIRALPRVGAAEVIVVDDSRPTEARNIQACCERLGAQYVRGPRRVGAKRNLGTRLSTAPIVAYLDSDCLASPDLLSAHLRVHRDGRAPSGRAVGAVAGPTLVPDIERSRAWRVVAPSVVVNSAWSWPSRFAEVWWAATANLSVRREAFDRVGGFDERTFTVVGGEDVDFGVRLHAAGFATVCDRDAVVAHRIDGVTSVAQFRRKMFRYGRAGTYNCRRQPKNAGWSANPISLGLIACVAGAAASALGGPAGRCWGRAVAAGSPGLVGAAFGLQVLRAVRAGEPASDAAARVSVDWAFHAGMTVEALWRGMPWLTLRRYDYFPPDRFYPYPDVVPKDPGR